MATLAAADLSTRVSLLQPEDAQLDQSLLGLELFLRSLGFCRYSLLGTALSWLAFALIGVVAPYLIIQYSYCSDCERYQIRTFELEILVSQAIAAAVSLLCISYNLRKYGIRKLLFVGGNHWSVMQFRDHYIRKIHVFYRLLVVWVVVCFLLKTAREVARMIYLHHGSRWQSTALLFVSLVPWIYLTVLYLSGAALFNLVGNLQILHFENYGKLLEKDLDISVYIEEHMHLTYNLSKISHRFRIFLLLEFLIVTASQFMALLQTTGNLGIINFINAGDFAALSIVQLVRIVLCLNVAAKVSHRAQGVASVASRWHALVTCSSNDASHSAISTNVINLDTSNLAISSFPKNYSESDLDDCVPQFPIVLPSSCTTSYHKRQSFVSYVHSNTGGFTIYGWTIDRVLVNTIFFIELSLVFFVLGKTITIPTR